MVGTREVDGIGPIGDSWIGRVSERLSVGAEARGVETNRSSAHLGVVFEGTTRTLGTVGAVSAHWGFGIYS